jgi:aspartate 1-decarboxylase
LKENAIMFREFMRVKIHRATVTETNVNYVGSITLPAQLCRQMKLGQNEKVDVLNVTTGSRVTTYVIYSDAPRVIRLNGAAAHHFSVGDKIIVIAYCALTEDEIPRHQARVALMNDDNSLHKIIVHENANEDDESAM